MRSSRLRELKLSAVLCCSVLCCAVLRCAAGMAKSIAWDGEGATVLIEIECTGAPDDAAACKVGAWGVRPEAHPRVC